MWVAEENGSRRGTGISSPVAGIWALFQNQRKTMVGVEPYRKEKPTATFFLAEVTGNK